MILSQEATPYFSNENIRGAALPVESFAARYLDCTAPGKSVEAFVVSPIDQLTGYGYDNASPKASYTAMGVYAVDADTLAQWQKGNLTSALTSDLTSNFNALVDPREKIFLTRSEALQTAEKINEKTYNSYLKDYQSGKLAGITNWRDTTGKSNYRPEVTERRHGSTKSLG